GGTYSFARRVLTVEVAFVVGWVVWFASIVAAVLYALGFAAYTGLVLERVVQGFELVVPLALDGQLFLAVLAIGATAFYTAGLTRRVAGGSQWPTIGKVVVFVVLILAGVWALAQQPAAAYRERLSPFFAHGGAGLFAAMGYTFIALQGFDLIAAVGGEVKEPGRNIPRAMLLSLAIALAIYLPFLLIVSVVGVTPGASITAMSEADPATVVARAAENYLGVFGFWLVIVAALLSMLSGLQANLFAASRMAFTMARDRTLPGKLGQISAAHGTPALAAMATGALVALTIVALPDVSAAGAAASLVFLISFALVHWTNVLMRRRSEAQHMPFRVPFFPLVPALGGASCFALALVQALAVPSAGAVAGAWLCLGWVLYLALFARRARVVDASAEALDPELVKLRGRTPRVLVPIANPASAAAMVEVAGAMAPPAVGRVLLLSVIRGPEEAGSGEATERLAALQQVLGEALTTSFAASLAPEALTVVAKDPWHEITRVANAYRCESILIGLGGNASDPGERRMESLVNTVDSDVIVLRSPAGWRLGNVRRVLVPVRGGSDHSPLRARLLGSLRRGRELEVTFLQIVPESASDLDVYRARKELDELASDEARVECETLVVRSADVVAEITSRTHEFDLVVLGLQSAGRRRKVFGGATRLLAEKTDCGLIMISHHG
ncbi:MAG: amino acid permease, partial [Acidobacteriota bacterium]